MIFKFHHTKTANLCNFLCKINVIMFNILSQLQYVRERLCLRVPIINNTLYQTQWAMFLQIKTHWLCSQQKQWYQIAPAKDNSNNTSTLKTLEKAPIYSISMTSYTPYNHRQSHIKPADRGFSPGLQDLFTPDIFFISPHGCSTWKNYSDKVEDLVEQLYFH